VAGLLLCQVRAKCSLDLGGFLGTRAHAVLEYQIEKKTGRWRLRRGKQTVTSGRREPGPEYGIWSHNLHPPPNCPQAQGSGCYGRLETVFYELPARRTFNAMGVASGVFRARHVFRFDLTSVLATSEFS